MMICYFFFIVVYFLMLVLFLYILPRRTYIFLKNEVGIFSIFLCYVNICLLAIDIGFKNNLFSDYSIINNLCTLLIGCSFLYYVISLAYTLPESANVLFFIKELLKMVFLLFIFPLAISFTNNLTEYIEYIKLFICGENLMCQDLFYVIVYRILIPGFALCTLQYFFRCEQVKKLQKSNIVEI